MFALALLAFTMPCGSLLADPAAPSRRHLLGDIAERCGMPRNAITFSRDGELRIQSRRGLRPDQVECAMAELRNRGLINSPPAGAR
jgi:hypothetical protein